VAALAGAALLPQQQLVLYGRHASYGRMADAGQLQHGTTNSRTNNKHGATPPARVTRNGTPRGYCGFPPPPLPHHGAALPATTSLHKHLRLHYHYAYTHTRNVRPYWREFSLPPPLFSLHVSLPAFDRA